MSLRDPNTRTAALALLACAGLILLIAVLSTSPVTGDLEERPSTFFTDPTGSRAAYLVLDELLGPAEQWRRPITELEASDGGEGPRTLIVLGPDRPLGDAEARSLDAWLVRGGQLILASASGWPMGEGSEDAPAPDFLSRYGLGGIEPAAENANPVERGRDGTDGIDGIDPLAAVRSVDVGQGRIVYVPDGYAFSNEALEDPDRAVWLVEQVAGWGPGVLFDEYHHGFGRRRGLLVLIGVFLFSPWGLVCLQAALAGGVYLARAGRRFGRPVEDLPIERTRPTEAVEAVAGLFAAARARPLAGTTILQYLNLGLSTRLGYRVDVSNDRIRERLAGTAGLERADLEGFARSVQALAGDGSSEEELVRIGQKATTIARSLTHGSHTDRPGLLAG